MASAPTSGECSAAGASEGISGCAPEIADSNIKEGNIMKRFTTTAIATAIAFAFGTAAIAAETAAAPAQSVNKKETPGEYVDDAVITSKVKAAVFQDSTLKATEINVETYKGIVQFTGFVKSRADINQAVRLAKRVKGVKSVKNDMVVKGKQ